MGLLKEFKEFASKGNFFDMAVGVIIGGAVGKIVNALVENVMMPPIAFLTGGKGVSDLFLSLDGESYKSFEKAKEAGAPVIGYGLFLQSLLDFIIIAFVLFLMLKGMNSLRKKQVVTEPEAPKAPTQEELLTEIRDLLKK